MMYQFKINVSDLPIVIEAYQEVGGYIGITPEAGGETVTVAFDNPDLARMNRIWMVRLIYDEPNNEASRVVVDRFCDKTEVKVLSETFDNDVKPQLQRKKIQDCMYLGYSLEDKKTKWELIKELQDELDGFPDDTVFTAFHAVGIGKFSARYV